MIWDAAVVGAGLAGAAAAAEFSRAGLRTVVIEARDRVGGRAFTRAFGTSSDILEFGGSWITPWQRRIRRHAELTGIALRPTHPIVEHRFHDGAALRVGLPCSEAARPAYDSSLTRLKSDVARYKAGEATDIAGLSLNAYLDRINASPEARLQVMAWWAISGNGDPEVISAVEFLASCAYGGGTPEGMMTALAHTLVPGATVLTQRMLALSGAELRLGSPVAKIRQEGDRITIAPVSGKAIEAKRVALCLPLNTIASIGFSPALPVRKANAASIGHGGRSYKLWIKTRGIRIGTLATGGPDGLRWMFAEREATDGRALIVGFALADDEFDPANRDHVARGLHRFFPEADLVAWDYHDWVVDPYALGTWVALPADASWIADSTLWAPEGCIAFASSDYAAEAPGWFEAALAAGEAAARTLLDLC